MKIAVVLHLYYLSSWEYIGSRLKALTNYMSLDTDIDLYVSLCVDKKDISQEILKDFPDAKIFILQNKGKAAGPFMCAFQYMIANDKKYDYILKLISKSKFTKDVNWKKELIDPFIGSPKHLDDAIKLISKNKESHKIAIPLKRLKHEDDYSWMEPILTGFNMKVDNIDRAYSDGGTFMAEYNAVLEFFKSIKISDFYDQMPLGKNNPGLCDAMEIIFCFLPQFKSDTIVVLD